MKLGVNIDHVATLRQARKAMEPDPVKAALLAQKGGCDSVVAHLREDRRHINENDISRIKKQISVKFNLEMSMSRAIVNFAQKIRPDQATIVPEKRQELTTEGGLDVVRLKNKVKEVIEALSKKGIEVSLFINPETGQVNASRKAGAQAIELHTGVYANARTNRQRNRELKKINRCVKLGRKLGLTVNAGHGLTYDNVLPIASISGIEELNIGHSIVSRSVFIGMEKAVSMMKGLIS